MTNKRLLTLLSKYQDNDCSQEELLELEQWYTQLNTGNQTVQDDEADTFSDEMLLQFREKISTNTIVIPFYRKPYFRIAAAASIILILSLGAYLKFFTTNKQDGIVKNNTPLQQDIASPKISKATITLGNGQTIFLDNINNGTLVKQGAVNVVKTDDGQIIYNGTATEAVYNTLFNPRGSKVISLTLNDGTKVWMNSESSLRYPVAFTGSERKVEITGEAYFEVAKNKDMPFYVVHKNAVVKVLGTHFNVNTYEDEKQLKVTLLEGSVHITNGEANSLLRPGQQALLNDKKDITVVNNIDLDEVMAWKNEQFYFNGADIKTIMRQVQKYYNVEIEYRDNVSYEFYAKISRQINVSEFLKKLEYTNLVHFKIEGNKIIIMK